MVRATLLVAGTILLAACASREGTGSTVTILERVKKQEVRTGGANATKDGLVQPTKTEEEQRRDARCKHAWEQYAWHLVEDPTGPGVAQMCVITRCPLCGEIRHECKGLRSR